MAENKPETPQQTIDRLTAENKQLQAKVAALEKKQKDQTEFDAAVARRMRPGLSREQAIAAETRQREFDAAKAKAAKATAKK